MRSGRAAREGNVFENFVQIPVDDASRAAKGSYLDLHGRVLTDGDREVLGLHFLVLVGAV